MRGIRGATQIEANTVQSIHDGVIELCHALCESNRLTPSRIISAIFTVTRDLDASFPARAVREQGWNKVPMICCQEIPVPGSLPRVVRVLLHAELTGEPKHVYLRGARHLRPDLDE